MNTIPFTKNSIRVDLIVGDAIEVRIRAAGRSHIATVNMAEYDGPAEMLVAVITDYIASSLPFGHADVADFVELRSIMQAHHQLGVDGFPFRPLLQAGWQFPLDLAAA